ncbi:MAG TPA: glycosyltransferase [Thermomicrobiales bacterium]|nr:glycosyltransferase [Thermomicrobiales bacterium]HRA47377.1 glycosyltransferase [Thermomicrobiales bacterium]
MANIIPNEPLRIAMISMHTSPLATLGGKDAGGMNVYIRDLAIQIARLGSPVDVYTRRSDPDRPRVQHLAPGVRVINLDVGPVADLAKTALYDLCEPFAREIVAAALLDGVRYDVIHAHYWLSGVTAELLRAYWEIPYSLMFHTTADMKNRVLGAADLESTLRSEVEARLVHSADSLIAANPDERSDLIMRHGAEEEKVCTIPPGVDLNLFHPMDYHESRSALGWDIHERVVLFVGRIDPIKGIDTLVDAMPLISEPFVKFVLIGGDLDPDGDPIGPLAEVQNRVLAMGMGQRVRYLGSQPQSMLPKYYSASDLVAVPSRYESFGLVAVEAMATGTPVVASSVGGLTFTITDYHNGFLVPLGDPKALAKAIDKLLEDDDLREKLGFNAAEDAQRFSWSSVATQVMHVYERLAEGYRADLCCADEIYA